MKEIHIKAGETKKIFSRAGSSIPETIEFEAIPIDPSQPVSGSVEIRGSSWIIPKKAIPHSLHPNNTFEKSGTDSNYALYVIPGIDVKIIMKQSSTWKWFWIIIFAAMLIVLGAGAIIILSQRPH